MPKVDATYLRERLYSIREIATLPSAVTRILMVTQNPQSTALDLAAEIVKDPALTLKVLRTVNSSFYGFNRRIQTVSDAVVLLGFTEVERIALAVAVISMLGSKREYARALTQLWRHSLAASVVAESLVEFEGLSGPQYAGIRVAGLLHDIGKAVLCQHFPDIYGNIMSLMKKRRMAACEAEAELMNGVTHCDIGAWLADRWKLPIPIVEAILLHQTPDKANDTQPLVHLVYKADLLCYRLEIPAVLLDGGAPRADESERQFSDDLVHRVGDRLERQRDIMSAIASQAF